MSSVAANTVIAAHCYDTHVLSIGLCLHSVNTTNKTAGHKPQTALTNVARVNSHI